MTSGRKIVVEITEVAPGGKGEAAVLSRESEAVSLELETGATNIKAITEVKSRWRERCLFIENERHL